MASRYSWFQLVKFDLDLVWLTRRWLEGVWHCFGVWEWFFSSKTPIFSVFSWFSGPHFGKKTFLDCLKVSKFFTDSEGQNRNMGEIIENGRNRNMSSHLALSSPLLFTHPTPVTRPIWTSFASFLFILFYFYSAKVKFLFRNSRRLTSFLFPFIFLPRTDCKNVFPEAKTELYFFKCCLAIP